MKGDLVNSLFMFIAIIFNCMNIYKLNKDKEVKGISIIPNIYYVLWGSWNIYFYAANKSKLSFIAGIGVVITGLIWVSQWAFYKFKKNN